MGFFCRWCVELLGIHALNKNQFYWSIQGGELMKTRNIISIPFILGVMLIVSRLLTAVMITYAQGPPLALPLHAKDLIE